MFKAKTIDATQGAMIPQIILFTIPLILTTLIQTLFNAVDIAVLGNMADTQAVAAVGSTTKERSLSAMNQCRGLCGYALL